MKIGFIPLAALATLLFQAHAGAQTIYTWVGTTSQLELDSNWSPSGGPPTSFADDDAVFNASGTTKTGLAPGSFAVRNLTFTGATYSFAAASLGDGINIGTGTAGTLTVSSGASVNFNDQIVTLNNAMSLSVSGTSSFQGGAFDASNLALGINFGAAQQNIARFGSLNLGASGNLTISNWGGTLGAFGGANNQLRFTSDPTALLSKISFSGYSGSTAATQNMGAYWEVVAVPEPSTWLLIGLGLTAIVIFRRRKAA